MSERKPDHERVNRNPRTHPDTWLVADGKVRGPELQDGVNWSDEAKEFWGWLRTSAQAMLFQDSDWLMMKAAMRVYNQMFTTKIIFNKLGDPIEVNCTPGELKSLHAEWRSATDTYGFTRQSRNRYGINIITPDELETEAIQAQIKPTHQVFDYREMFKE